MFNPHIHQQQQQQFHQQLRQLQQLFQQQQPPPPPPQPPPGHHVAHHHHQTPRAIPVPTQTAPPPRMVNLSHASQTTIIAPNPMLQGALLMQQMQGNMRGFGMGGQQFRQFFTAGNRSSLLGPVPMGMAIKSPIMGFPAARPFHPHPRYFNNNNTATSTASSASSSTDAATRQLDRKRDSEQMAAGSSDDQPAAASSIDGANGKTQADGAVGGVDGPTQISEEQLEEPAVKKKRTEGSEKPSEQGVVEAVTTANNDEEALSSACSNNTEDVQPEECIALEEEGSRTGSDIVEALEEIKVGQVQSCLSAPSPTGRPSEGEQQANLPAEETLQGKDVPEALPENQDEEEGGTEGVAEGSNKFYCYLCSITCHNQQNFRSHMNSMSHQQRMMEIQHMSNACLVTLLPRVQESLQGANKDGEKKADLKRWCATCLTHFTSSIADHRRTEEHKLASKTDMSSCAICKKHFKNSQMFLEHLQTQEHRQKLQEKDCEAFAKLTSVDTEGFSLEAEEGTVEEEGGIEGLRNEGDGQDGWSSVKEMTLNDVASDEQYDPDTVYGSSFLVPVAGFICRLCNKFYNFESSALHTHCKSLQHFENLKRYSMLMSRKGEKVESSRESVQAADGLVHVKETASDTSDCSDKNLLSDDTELAANRKSLQPVVTLTNLKIQTRRPQKGKRAEPEAASEDLSAVSATSSSNTDTSLAELTASSSAEADSEPSASVEDAIEEVDEKEAPVTQGKKNGTGKAKTTARRRSGRATNRR